MPEDFFRYDLMVQNALRGVVRDILNKVAADGLPGDHHFYIAFQTKAPGVNISARFHEKYPEEMTIVIQHQYWDLNVTEDKFEIGLSFNNIPEKLVVPFAALTGFMDPSTQFALQFQHHVANDELDEETDAEEGSLVPSIAAKQKPGDKESPPSGKPKKTKKDKKPAATSDADSEQDVDETSTGEVVQLDAFRKKS